MRINHNIAAINTNRLLGANNTNTSKALEKLSSGLAVNRAGDNAAGLAISEKMRGQIRGLDQATKNANDGIKLIQTTEGALNETHSILQRMRELAVQSANDTNTNDDRTEIQKEIEQLTKEITRIATDTEFNTKKLLDGTMAATATQDAAPAGVTTSVAAGSILEAGTYTVTLTYATADADAVPDAAATGGTGATASFTATGTATVGDNGTNDIQAGTWTTADNGNNWTLQGGGGTNTTRTAAQMTQAGITVTGAVTGSIITVAADGAVTASGTGSTPAFTAEITDAYDPTKAPAGNYEYVTNHWENDAGETVDLAAAGIDITGATDGSTLTITAGTPAMKAGDTIATVTDADGNTVSASNFKFDVADGTAAFADQEFTVTVDTKDAMTFHIGANQGQNTKLTVQSMTAEDLGVDAIDLTTQASADAAITTIDDAINTVSAQRAALGAMQNRLEHTISNLGTSSENLTAAESQIRDVDMAEEMSEFTKNNILVQAATSMLAQANQQPQNVLSLLQ